jgi:glycosyltransferase involved in cell wall biosynthesis
MTNKLKKITVLCHSAAIGGAELALASLIESTHKKYVWQVIFADTKKAPKELIQFANKVNYIDLPWWCYEAHDRPRLFNIDALNKSMKVLEKLTQDSDLLVTNTITIPWLSFVAQRINKPHIWYIHEFGDIDHNLQFILGFKESLKIIDDNSSRVLTISNAVKYHLSEVIPENKIDIIHQSIDFSKIYFSPIKKINKKIKLLTLGAIKPSKGQHSVIEAVKKANLLSDLFTLDIIGPNANQDYVKKIQRDTINNPEITIQPRYFEPNKELISHDVLVMASENEALGRVTLEGLASGKIVIGYSCLSTSEILANNRGILYSPNTPDALSKTLKNIVKLSGSIDYKKNRLYTESVYGPTSQANDFKFSLKKAIDKPISTNNTYSLFISEIERSGLFISRTDIIKLKIHKLISRFTPSKLKSLIRELRRL